MSMLMPYFMTNEEWYTCPRRGVYKLTDKAPEEAKKSYEEYKKALKKFKKMKIEV